MNSSTLERVCFHSGYKKPRMAVPNRQTENRHAHSRTKDYSRQAGLLHRFFCLCATGKINTNILRTTGGQYGHLRRVRYTVLDLCKLHNFWGSYYKRLEKGRWQTYHIVARFMQLCCLGILETLPLFLAIDDSFVLRFSEKALGMYGLPINMLTNSTRFATFSGSVLST